MRLKRPAWRGAGCLGLIGAGVVATVWPTVTAEILVRVLAFVAFVIGAAGLLDLVGSYQWNVIVNPRAAVHGAPHRRSASSARSTCFSVVLLVRWPGVRSRLASARHPIGRRCTRSGATADIALCDRAVDEVAFVGAHNAMGGSREDGWFFRNHSGGINAQLGAGVRAFMLDLHYGAKTQQHRPHRLRQ